MNFSQIDLNQLVMLKHLLHEKHVSNTALVLNLSQPTVSRALNKLRKLFSDPLLVRSSTGYELTPKAERIKLQLNSVLADLEELIDGEEFEPDSSEKTIKFFGLAPHMDLMFPEFLARMRTMAPNMTFELDTVSKPHFDGLLSGEHHFVISHHEPPFSDQELYRHCLLERDFRLVMSASHPLANEELTPELLQHCHFGQVALQGDKRLSIEPRFQELGLLGKNGRISTPVRLNNFSSAIPIAASTDVIFHLPTSYAKRAVKCHDIVCRVVPKALQHPSKDVYLYWHKRYHQDPAFIWIRNQYIESIKNKGC
ncbi:transcriptional regulator LysR family [Vibrio maritimus]|uniref:Transcriptional regulator LysR family n=1 Tax=Vibrio maritimus TaxID=990268 RepID=A0A090RQ24_9VIBR|nr:transcriptional regulator LysR family [Vibrio maritimus]